MARPALPLVAASLLFGLFWWMAVSVSKEHCVVADEIAHMTAGYSYWDRNDYRLQPENGNFPQRWAALPLLAMPLSFPKASQAGWTSSDVWEVGYQFFYESGNPLAKMLQAARSMSALLGVLCAAIVFGWSRSLFGTKGALVSAGLFAFCPNLLAHAGLATSDMAASLAFLLAVLTSWRLLHRVTPCRILAAGGALGFLALCKFSAPVIVPVIALMMAVRLRQGAPLPLRIGRRAGRVRGLPAAGAILAGFALAAVLGVGVIWAGYGFRFSAFSASQPAGSLAFSWDQVLLQSPLSKAYTVQESALLRPGAIQACVRWARDRHLLPEAWLFGFAHVCRFALWRPAFFLGEYRTTGWLLFFPVAFLAKTPLPTFGVLAISAAGVAGLRGRSRRLTRLLYRLVPLAAFLAIYWCFAVTSHLNIGLRHVLPTYPALYILAGACALPNLGRIWRSCALIFVALQAGISLGIRPDYLAYFNPILGGPQKAYRSFVDSSLDWGQDLPGLKRWLDIHAPPGVPVFLSYFGSGSPAYEGIHATRIADSGFDLRQRTLLPTLTGGIYCISATMFQQVYTKVRHGWSSEQDERYRQLQVWLKASKIRGLDDSIGPDGSPMSRGVLVENLTLLEDEEFGRICAFLRSREPDDNVGHSILIYRLSDAEVQRYLQGPPPAFTP